MGVAGQSVWPPEFPFVGHVVVDPAVGQVHARLPHGRGGEIGGGQPARGEPAGEAGRGLHRRRQAQRRVRCAGSEGVAVHHPWGQETESAGAHVRSAKDVVDGAVRPGQRHLPQQAGVKSVVDDEGAAPEDCDRGTGESQGQRHLPGERRPRRRQEQGNRRHERPAGHTPRQDAGPGQDGHGSGGHKPPDHRDRQDGRRHGHPPHAVDDHGCGSTGGGRAQRQSDLDIPVRDLPGKEQTLPSEDLDPRPQRRLQRGPIHPL